ncbi:MAG: flagellar hook protein FlgE [Alphaproteobacteria bacterium]|nr:flagellar hook protein FlgE [Alphaproteobacteria bacterium]
MSLFDAMNTAVSGLNAQGAAMSNISNNIANAQTVGYKSDDTSFADLVAGSGGGGTAATTGYDVGAQGTLVSTSTTSNLGIYGNGFFAVESGETGANGAVSFAGGTEYTRRGDFAVSAQGYLVNSTGSYLEGYAVGSNGNVDTSALVPIQIPQSASAPAATGKVSLNANLPANASTTTSLSPTTLQVYDAEGNTHSVEVNWTMTGANQWSAEVTVPDAKGGFDNTLGLGFSGGSGTSAGTIQSMTSSSSAFTVPTNQKAGQAATASFSVDFGSGPQTITLNLGSFNQPSGLTQYSSSNQQVTVSSVTQDGSPSGTYQSMSIDGNGNLSVNYSNGQSKTLYQIPVVTFRDPDGLQESSAGGLWSATAASGAGNIDVAGNGGAGTIQSSSLENSNVNLTGEFTKMIQTQQIYSANSRAITTANDMLSDLLNVVHA